MLIRIITTTLLLATSIAAADDQSASTEPKTGPGLLSKSYRDAAKRIIDTTMEHNLAYERLEHLCTQIGNRLTGSKGLTLAINWAEKTMHDDGQDNVRTEPVTVPIWRRGTETLNMLMPRQTKLSILGLGGTVRTPAKGVIGEVVVVDHEDDFLWLKNDLKGKIVLYNNKMPAYTPENGAGYGKTVRFRHKGASLAAQYGAAAVLVRSVTAKSLGSPHTGSLVYDEHQPKIPAAAISVEDAELIARLVKKGTRVSVRLLMTSQNLPDAISANVIGELRGSTNPEEIVLIGGHLDSWDVGQGAHDDGGGCVIAIEAIRVLRKLNLIPRRTIRVVLWTNEENGLRGARAYAQRGSIELGNHVAAIESDGGVFHPTGYSVEMIDKDRQAVAADQMRDIMHLLAPLGPMEIDTGFSGADIGAMRKSGFPLIGHRVDGSTYFDIHHTVADTIDKVDPEELSMNVASLATVAYILADMPNRLGSTSPDKHGSTH